MSFVTHVILIAEDEKDILPIQDYLGFKLNECAYYADGPKLFECFVYMFAFDKIHVDLFVQFFLSLKPSDTMQIFIRSQYEHFFFRDFCNPGSEDI